MVGRQQKVIKLTAGAVVFIVIIALAVPVSLFIANVSVTTTAAAGSVRRSTITTIAASTVSFATAFGTCLFIDNLILNGNYVM